METPVRAPESRRKFGAPDGTGNSGSRRTRKFEGQFNDAASRASDRARELARIHCLLRDLGFDDSTYRDVLWAVARVRSAADLDAGQRREVIRHMARALERRSGAARPSAPARPRGRSPYAPPLPTGAAADAAIANYLGTGRRVYGQAPRTLANRPLLRKIEAQLADAGRPWGYALALAKRIAKKDALELCSDADLGKLVAALAIDQERRRRRAAEQRA